MKIRIRANSLRLRLTQSEVSQLQQRGVVEEVTPFGESQLLYSLKASNAKTLCARFADNRIEVLVPEQEAAAWASDETQVGISAEMPVGQDKHLAILVEKDFACLQVREGEDDRDTFPNPLA